jgi:hypothetical protein
MSGTAQTSPISQIPRFRESQTNLPAGGDLAEVVDGEMFVDEADVAGTMVRTTHRIHTLDDRSTRVVYRLEASGPAADAIGPALSADFGDTLAALVAFARR